MSRRPESREPVLVRDAHAGDAGPIARIYNEGIQDRLATLETTERSAEERQSWLAGRDHRHPVLIAERQGRVVGWASINPFNPRDAYRHVADFSLYVARDARGSGIGSALLAAVIERARQHRFHKLVLSGFPWNTAGLALYRRFGFREVGTYREQGALDGRWVDVVVMELLLDRDSPGDR